VHTRHQLGQASKHHKQKRVLLVDTGEIVVESPRTIVSLVAVRVKLVCISLVIILGVPLELLSTIRSSHSLPTPRRPPRSGWHATLQSGKKRQA
jgi:hypothetical protein